MNTRKEWFDSLKKYICSLPESEQRKAIDYYNEIFEDKYESGMSEKQIVDGFGSPYDAATTIINEYQTENPDWKRPKYDPTTGTIKSNPYGNFTPTYNYTPQTVKNETEFQPSECYKNHTVSNSKNDLDGIAVFLCVIIGIILYPIAVCISLSFISACLYLIIGGATGVGYCIFYSATTTTNYLAFMGLNIALIGIGIIMLYPVIFGSKQMFQGILKLFKLIRSEFMRGEIK